MDSFEYGVIDTYSSAKRFGFVTVDGPGDQAADRLFFHYHQQYQVLTDDAGNQTLGQRVPSHKLRKPKVGDRLILQRSVSDHGPKAKRWGFAPPVAPTSGGG